MTRRFGLPLAVSLVGHGALLVLLVFLMARLPPMPLPLSLPRGGIEVLLVPPPAPAPPAPAAVPLPEPPPPVVKTEPPPTAPILKPEPPAPRRSPPARARVTPPPRQPPPDREVAPVSPAPPVVTRPPSPPTPVPPAAAPAAPAAPVVSAGYRAALSAWLERHKQYPAGARARGEEGQAVLRFRVDRAGRVLGYSIVRGTGYADLDAAIDRMMRGAVLPPFPADMTAPEIEVSVTLRLLPFR